MAQQEWRIPTLMNKLLEELKPFLTHSFMSVRDRLGSMITNIFISDLDFSTFPQNTKNAGGNKRNPKVVDFITEVLPQLEMLASSEDWENGSSSSGSKTPSEQVPIEAQIQPMMGGKMPQVPPEMLR